MEQKRLIIIDSNSVIHRAYHALPPLTTKKGEVVGAVYGFLLVFLKAIKEFQPDFVVACFDLPGPTFRSKIYKEYKAKRPPTPEELCRQIPKVKEILKSFNVPIFDKEGFEADDIIGTIATLVAKKQSLPRIETIILSGDTDNLQLIDSQTKAYILRKGVKDTVLYDKKQVQEKFQGLIPEQLLDFKALRGDPSDNIPGVTGVGEKTATRLLMEFGSLENLYKAVREDKSSSSPFTAVQVINRNSEKTQKIKPKLKEILLKHKEEAFLSKTLARIERNVSIDFNLEKCRWKEYDEKKASQILKNFEFYSLIKKLPLFKNRKEGLVGETLKMW